MDALEVIFTRRSIRKYTKEEVSQKQIKNLLRAAMIAPSTVNNLDWAFVVIRDKSILNSLAQGLKPDAEMLRDTSHAIAVCGDLELAYKKEKDFWIQDCAAASENILLAAHAEGLGAVWLAVYPQKHKVENVISILKLPGHIVPFNVISIGWPAEKKEAAADMRYDEGKIHYDTW